MRWTLKDRRIGITPRHNAVVMYGAQDDSWVLTSSNRSVKTQSMALSCWSAHRFLTANSYDDPFRHLAWQTPAAQRACLAQPADCGARHVGRAADLPMGALLAAGGLGGLAVRMALGDGTVADRQRAYHGNCRIDRAPVCHMVGVRVVTEQQACQLCHCGLSRISRQRVSHFQ